MLRREHIHLLSKLGLTETEATVYLALLKTGNTDARRLAALAKLPRTGVYRVLGDLQRKGLVEKELGLPLKYCAVPPNVGLQNSIAQKFEELKEIEKEVQEFVQEHWGNKEEEDRSEYKIRILEGRRRIIQLIKQEHDNAKIRVDIVSTLPRWLQIIEDCIGNYYCALDRGVKYRVILAIPEGDLVLPKNARSLLEMPDFKMRTVTDKISVNSAVFDLKEAIFNYYPSKALGESPLIWTNHPSFISMCCEHFEATWKKTEKGSAVSG